MKEIKITIEVYEYGATYRKGNLYVDGRLILKTLEDKDRSLNQSMDIADIMDRKVFGDTAIPFGTYKVKYRWSNLNNAMVPGLIDVKGFRDIEIHVGNSSKDCKGCILVGVDDKPGHDWIGFSGSGMRMLNDYLCKGKNVDITLTIKPI